MYGDLFLRTVDAVEAKMHVRVGTDDDIAVDEIWNENVYRLHPDHVKDRVVFDIGANSGAFSLWAAAAGAEKVYAYEPQPDNFAALQKNVDGYNVECVNAALSNFNGSGSINGLDNGSGSGFLSSGGTIQVRNFKNELLKASDIAVLKMDIEGSEYNCFSSIESSDLGNVEKLVMEFHGPGMSTIDNTLSFDFGSMITKIAEWGHVDILGRPSIGGMIYGVRY